MISLSKPKISQKAIDRVVDVIKSGWVTQGPLVSEFEEAFSKYVKCQYALAVNSATSGLHAALVSLGVSPGDEVIVPAFTWVATANVVEVIGAKPIFVDIDLETYNANIEKILEKISDRTKVIYIVHLFGHPFDVLKLRKAIPAHIKIVEDAACAVGSLIGNKFCGTLGDIGVYSFHPRKSITTGEGGMLVTNDQGLAKKVAMFRNHGQDTSYKEKSPAYMFDCPEIGLNYRMTDIQAALGIEQLKEINQIITYRDELVGFYKKYLFDVKDLLTFPNFSSKQRTSWQSLVLQYKKPEKRHLLMEKLQEVGIETRPGTHAIHLLSYYKNKYKFKPTDFPNAYHAFKGTLSIPLHNQMTKDDVIFVSKKIIEALNDIK